MNAILNYNPEEAVKAAEEAIKEGLAKGLRIVGGKLSMGEAMKQAIKTLEPEGKEEHREKHCKHTPHSRIRSHKPRSRHTHRKFIEKIRETRPDILALMTTTKH